MECPRCGEEMAAGKECQNQKCGKGALPAKEMEVQYKEFKVSELLDIRMTSPPPSGAEGEKPEYAQGKADGSVRPAHPNKGPSARKMPLVLAAFIALLAVVAGFYLLRFLFHF
jgi:hypothetical protein